MTASSIHERIQSNVSLGTKGNIFHNQAFEDKIAKVQAEFNALLAERNASPSKRAGTDGDALEKDQFYQVMGEFYGSMKKHESPTRRLMDQQKASWKHKNHLYAKMKSGEIDSNQYSLTYTVDPKATYVIQPKEGEINYDLARSSPVKFYDSVMNQDVVEHKVARKRAQPRTDEPTSGELKSTKTVKRGGLEVTSRLTKRSVAQILFIVSAKLHKMISEVTGGEFDPEDVREALNHPQTKGIVQKHILAEGIRMTDPSRGVVVFKGQMHLLG